MTEPFFLMLPIWRDKATIASGEIMTDVIAREIVNTGWAMFCWMMVIILGRRLFVEIQQDGWYAELGNRVAVGLFIYFIGSGMYRTWIVGLLWGIDNDTGSFSDLYLIPFISMTIGLLGGLCTIRLLTKTNWPWFITYCLIMLSSAFVASQKL